MTKILDLGTKFIPNFFNGKFDVFLNYFYNLSSDIVDLNCKLFFYKPNKETYNSTLKSNALDPYEDFFKYCKIKHFKKNIDKFPIISESLKFQVEALKNINKVFSENNVNLSKRELFFFF